MDTLTWKLVGKLVTELLLSNSGKLLGILVAAAANNAAASAANAISSTIETAFNYNPISLAKSGYGSMKRLQRANENLVGVCVSCIYFICVCVYMYIIYLSNYIYTSYLLHIGTPGHMSRPSIFRHQWY